MSKTDANKKHTAEFYRRKCHDLMLELKQMRTAFGQLSEVIDGTLVQVAKRYGKKVKEKRKVIGWKRKVIGWRIEIAPPDLEGCTVKSEKRDGEYIIGVIAPEEESNA